MTAPTGRPQLIDAIYQSTRDLVYILASDGMVLDANRSAHAFTELPFNEFIGVPLWTTPGWSRYPELAAWLRDCIGSLLAGRPVRHLLVKVDTTGGSRLKRFTMGMLAGPAPNQKYVRVLAHDVVIEEQTVAAVRESRRFLAALDAAGDALVIAHAERDAASVIISKFVILDVNQRAAEHAGENAEALRGRSLLDLFPPSRDAGLWEQCCQVVETRAPLELTQSAPIPGVPGHWIRRHIVPLGDGVAIASRDMTRKEHERALLEASEARYRKLFEGSEAIQLIVDVETGALIEVNPAAEAFYGWPRATMRSMLVTDIDGRTLDAWRAEAGSASVLPHAVTYSHRVANGESREVEIAASPLDLSGRATRHLIVHNCSDRKLAERQLRESEARFRAVINGMSEGVVVYDEAAKVREFNPEAVRILGITAEEMGGAGASTRDWKAVREDGSAWPRSEFPPREALRTGRHQPRTLMGIRRGNGENIWLQIVADPLIREGEESPYGAVAVFIDVTLQRNAEERLRQAQKLEAVGQLAGGIAHDFNNLLTVIRGASTFLHDAVPADSPHLEDVKAIERATERAEELTRRLLAVGRRQLLSPESVDLGALLQEQFATIRDDTPLVIRVELALPQRRAMARLDRGKLLDALRALVDNARAAMPAGGTLTLAADVRDIERPTKTSATAGSQPFAMLEVRDTGEGMSEEVRARLFEPFFSTQPFGANHGMGLASVHGMVAQSHGFMECDSAPGKGTSFRLFFPFAAETTRGTATPISSKAVQSRGVLLVDDDPMLRDLGARMLERLGHSAAVVESGADALALLASGAVKLSVMVTDLTMPGMNGMELIGEVERQYPRLPIVAISGFSMDPAVRQVLADRQIPFVGKPFSAEELEHAMELATAEKALPAT